MVCFIAVFITLSSITIERNYMWKDAETLWSDTLKKNEKSYFAHINLANDSFEKKNYKRAEKDFIDIITRWPGQPEAYNNLSIIYKDTGRPAAAAVLLKKGLAAGINNPELYFNLAVVYRDLRKYDAALAEAEKAAALKPELPNMTLLMTDIYMGKGKEKLKEKGYQEALAALLKAVAYGYNFHDIHRYLAEAYYGAGHYVEAIREYSEVLKVNRNYLLAYFFVGDAYNKIGKKREAQQAFEIFMSRWRLGGKYYDMAEKKLKALKEGNYESDSL